MGEQFLIPYVRSVWKMLRYRLGTAGRMSIFGAGAHTRWLLSVTADLPSPPIECILDDNSTEKILCGIPVRQPGDVDPEALDVVLVSSDRWEDRLVSRIRRLWGDRVELVRLYEDLPAGPYDKGDDRTDALRTVGAMLPYRSAEDRQVVIVSDCPRSREAKIGYALKHAGWRTILLHRNDPTFHPSPSFDHLRRFGNSWKALRAACDYSPVVYHVMVNSDYRLAELFLRHRPGVIVVDSYDLIAGMYTDQFLSAHPDFAEEMERERCCLEQADGICCRSRESEVLEQKLAYRFHRRLMFPDGCWNNAPPAMRLPNDELHLVYAGTIDARVGTHTHFASCGCNLELARGLAEQGLHFHVFAASSSTHNNSDQVFAVYRELERASPYLHFHGTVLADVLRDALSRFHAAISVYPELVISTGAPSGLTQDKLRCCTSNKFYDYIDAGLPIIHNAAPESNLAGMVNRHGIGIDVSGWPFADWGGRLRGIELPALRPRLAQARQDYDVRNAVCSLTEFYVRVRHDATARADEVLPPSEGQTDADDRRQYRPTFV